MYIGFDHELQSEVQNQRCTFSMVGYIKVRWVSNVHEVYIKENISPPCPSPHIGEKKKEEYVEEKRNKQ